MGKDFLKEIVEHKKKEVARAKRSTPIEKIREMALCGKENRPFFENLKNLGPSGVNIIAEIKRASPSKGDIRLDIDPALYAREYEAGGARAISVLTDTVFFKGSFEDLKTVRQNTSLPILRKDFLVSSYQIYESLTIGADAVLLIVRILSKKQLEDYLSLCKELKLDALVEINSEEDIEIATLSGATLIGINNRDLSSFETDVNTAMRLKSLLGPDQVAVAASGISNRRDIEKNLAFGITSFLIGESLVRADNTRGFLRALMKKDGK
jgi:indole-3-glycerol phosphate synthase